MLLTFYWYNFIGVLRDTGDDIAIPAGYKLSGSQNQPYQHVLEILKTMQPVSDEYLEEEVDDYEQTNVSQFACHISC